MEIVQTLRSVSVVVIEENMCMKNCNTIFNRLFSTTIEYSVIIELNNQLLSLILFLTIELIRRK